MPSVLSKPEGNLYTEEAAAQMTAEIAELNRWERQFKLSFVERRFRTQRGREYAFHGLLRRIGTISHCLEAVFREVPPRFNGIPERGSLKTAESMIQAFVFNVFGALDNLAWVWVSESNLRRPNGLELSPRQIGLGPRCTIVRESFSEGYRSTLNDLGDWFAHIEDFRHALAHRIPIYIPPYTVPEGVLEEYRRLERAKLLCCNADEYAGLERQVLNIVHFSPIMTHSLLEPMARTVRFHPQLIGSFKALRVTTEGLFAEFERLPAAGA